MTRATRRRPAAAKDQVLEPAVRWLESPGDEALLGGKGRALARLLAAGLPVPPGFVITAIRDAAAPLPERTEDAIREAYGELGARMGEAEPLVAVRSSALAEDLEGASFAGQYETYLGVRGAEAVMRYVKQCIASLSAEHAQGYRRHAAERLGALPEAAMAVVVQALVWADAAGVAFTADPLTGDESAVVLNAAWGLGQSIVDGEVEPDTWRVSRDSGAILEQRTGHKPTRAGTSPEAPPLPVPEAEQDAPCLTEAQARSVAQLAVRASEVIQAPADVEWARTGDIVWLLQARPITTGAARSAAGDGLAPPAAAVAAEELGSSPPAPAGPSAQFPFRWPAPELAKLSWELYARGDPSAPEPELPFKLALGERFNAALRNAAAIKGREKQPRVIVLNGYQYGCQEETPWSAEERAQRQATFQRPADALAERGETYWHAVLFPEVEAEDSRLGQIDVEKLSPLALAAHLEETLRWHERAWTLHWLWTENNPEQRFRAFYKELTKDEREDAHKELCGHVPNMLTAAIDGLLELARIVQARAPLRALFEAETPSGALAALDGVRGGDEFRAALDRLLSAQGLRCGEGYGTEQDFLPGWAEEPALVIALVQRYARQDLVAIRVAHAAVTDRQERRVAEVRGQIEDEASRERFDFLLAGARRQVQAFEDHNYYIDSAANSLVHRATMAGARRLAGAGLLLAPNDVWWLTPEEIVLALGGLEPQPAGAADGTAPERATALGEPAGETSHRSATARLAEWPKLIAGRKALYEWYRTLTPPKRLGVPPPAAPTAEPPKKAEAVPTSEPPSNVLLKGQTGSAGKAEGRVRLVSRDTIVPDVVAGDILVARNAGPVWTPVFPLVAAVVLDEGAMFQHAMLTCREYGVPAVFQTKDATAKLREGQRVVVDGSHGWVLPAEDAD